MLNDVIVICIVTVWCTHIMWGGYSSGTFNLSHARQGYSFSSLSRYEPTSVTQHKLGVTRNHLQWLLCDA